jgi:hypothetical protein
MNNQKQQTDTTTPRDACSLALASAEEMSPPADELQRNQRKGRKGRGKRAAPRDVCSLALASAEEMSHPPKHQRNWRQERERHKLKANNEEEDASSNVFSDEEMKPGAVAVP